MQSVLPDLMVKPNFAQWEIKFSCIDAGTLEGIKATWQFLDSYRHDLIEKSEKFESEKKLFESNRAKEMEQIHLDVQLKFQHKFEEFINQLNEASHLLKVRKQKIVDQSQYISELEEKLKSPRYNFKPAVTAQEKELNKQIRFELERENVSLKSDIQMSNVEFQKLVESKNTEKRFFENRVIQLQNDVIQLDQERKQLQEIVQQLLKQKQKLEKDYELAVDLKFVEHDDVVSAEQLDQEEATQLVDLSTESSGCHSEADSNWNEVEDLATPREMDPLNWDESTKEIFQVFKHSSSQFTVASNTYHKICSLRLEYSERARAKDELLEACYTNIHCLQAIQFSLKTFDSSAGNNVTLVKSIQQLTRKWVQLDAKLFVFQQDVQQPSPICLEQSATFQKRLGSEFIYIRPTMPTNAITKFGNSLLNSLIMSHFHAS